MRRSRPDAEAPPPGQARASSYALVVTGALMLVTALLKANPAFGAEEQWPWEFVMEGGPSLLSVMYALWVVVGLCALALGLTPGRRPRAMTLLVLGLVLLIGGCELAGYKLAPILALILLGGGLLVTRRPAARGLGRLLAGMGAVAAVWILASTFSEGFESGRSQLQVWWADVGLLVKDWGHDFAREHHVWRSLLPTLLLLLAALGGLLAACCVKQRVLLLIAFCLLLAGLLMPIGVDVAVELAGDWDWAALVSLFSDRYETYFVLLWLLGVFVTVDLSHLKERAV